MRIGSEYQAVIPEFGTPPSGESPSLFTFSFGGGGNQAVSQSIWGGRGIFQQKPLYRLRVGVSHCLHIFTIHAWIAMLLLGYM